MALFRIIEQTADLPSEGTSRETLLLDAKANYDVSKKFEMGKDVAAFANATGGTLLIGAFEDSSKLIRYRPLCASDAVAVRQSFEEAIRDRCTPLPRVTFSQITYDPGEILAINVWPFPGQAVGVCRDGNKKVASNGFVFPIRTATQTDYLLPEQLPLLMLPELRRTAILLDSIPHEARNSITIHAAVCAHGVHGSNSTSFSGELIDYSYLSNSFKIKIHPLLTGYGAESRDVIIGLPLDRIKSVWEYEGNWIVAIGGRFSENHRNWYYD
jgi:hypothetical protein